MAVSTSMRGIVPSFLAFLNETLDFMFPACCSICGKLADADDRFTQYEDLRRAYGEGTQKLHICGKCLSLLVPYEPDKRWLFCLSNPYEGDPLPGLPLYVPLNYDGTAGYAIPAVKFGKKKELANFLGCILGTCLKTDNVGADLIVPVPLSESRMKERGFNQAAEMAKPAAAIAGIPFAGNVLLRTRETERQTELKGNLARISNVTDAFAVSGEWDIEGLTVIVVDDVATTGFTLHEAAMALYGAGASKVLCAALASNRLVKNAEPY